MPPGIELPPGCSYVFIGHHCQSWDSVGVFLRRDFLAAFTIMESASSSPRRLWLRVLTMQGATLFICAFYGPPGGDSSFFSALCDEARSLLLEHPDTHTVLALGDANIHWRFDMGHHARCTCLHCRPPRQDREAEQALQAFGFVCANNASEPTHKSKTIIDILLSTQPAIISDVTVCGCPYSDHDLVIGSICAVVEGSLQDGYGRVQWQCSDKWHAAMEWSDGSMQELADLVASFVHDDTLSRKALLLKNINGRRALLDACAWLRDVWVVLVGHLCGMVRLSSTSRSNHDKLGTPAEIWESQKRNWTKYVELRHSNPADASRVLSSLLRPSSHLQLALRDPVDGHPMSPSETIDALTEDLLLKSDQAQSADGEFEAARRAEVQFIRANGALVEPGSLTKMVDMDQLFSQTEVNTVINRLNKNKKCFRGSYSCMKALGFGGRALVCALQNLSFALGITASEWSLRQTTPIHKKGPLLVHSIVCTRPISQASDMTAVQDGLFLLRHRRKLEVYWGPCQGGGRTEALSFALATYLLVQLRTGANLPTIVNFADIWAGFDTVPVDICIGAFSAGFVGRT